MFLRSSSSAWTFRYVGKYHFLAQRYDISIIHWQNFLRCSYIFAFIIWMYFNGVYKINGIDNVTTNNIITYQSVPIKTKQYCWWPKKYVHYYYKVCTHITKSLSLLEAVLKSWLSSLGLLPVIQIVWREIICSNNLTGWIRSLNQTVQFIQYRYNYNIKTVLFYKLIFIASIILSYENIDTFLLFHIKQVKDEKLNMILESKFKNGRNYIPANRMLCIYSWRDNEVRKLMVLGAILF